MSTAHTLMFWIDRKSDNPIHSDGTLTVQVDCPQVDDACRMWRVCDDEEHDHEELERLNFEECEEQPYQHGTRHLYIDGDYMVPTDHCYMRCVSDRVYPTAEQLVEKESLEPGAYLVGHRFEDGDLVEFTLIAAIGHEKKTEELP